MDILTVSLSRFNWFTYLRSTHLESVCIKRWKLTNCCLTSSVLYFCWFDFIFLWVKETCSLHVPNGCMNGTFSHSSSSSYYYCYYSSSCIYFLFILTLYMCTSFSQPYTKEFDMLIQNFKSKFLCQNNAMLKDVINLREERYIFIIWRVQSFKKRPLIVLKLVPNWKGFENRFKILYNAQIAI